MKGLVLSLIVVYAASCNLATAGEEVEAPCDKPCCNKVIVECDKPCCVKVRTIVVLRSRVCCPTQCCNDCYCAPCRCHGHGHVHIRPHHNHHGRHGHCHYDHTGRCPPAVSLCCYKVDPCKYIEQYQHHRKRRARRCFPTPVRELLFGNIRY